MEAHHHRILQGRFGYPAIAELLRGVRRVNGETMGGDRSLWLERHGTPPVRFDECGPVFTAARAAASTSATAASAASAANGHAGKVCRTSSAGHVSCAGGRRRPLVP